MFLRLDLLSVCYFIPSYNYAFCALFSFLTSMAVLNFKLHSCHQGMCSKRFNFWLPEVPHCLSQHQKQGQRPSLVCFCSLRNHTRVVLLLYYFSPSVLLCYFADAFTFFMPDLLPPSRLLLWIHLGIISKLFVPKVKRNGFPFLPDFKIHS
jgi:hypothetical protein